MNSKLSRIVLCIILLCAMSCQLFMTAYGISDAYTSVDIAGTTTDPNDTYYDQQKDVYELIQLPEAWEYIIPDITVLVGVIDSGINASHPDLCEMINTSLSKTFLPGSDSSFAPTQDLCGHGTHVAGIIAAQSNNIGVCGVTNSVRLVSLKVAYANGNPLINLVTEAIKYATEKKIPILNFSGGFKKSEVLALENGEDLLNELRSAVEKYPGLIICSAGNDNSNIDVDMVYPASFDFDNILVVGASSVVNGVDALWYESTTEGTNTGRLTVDIFAPGYSIISCFPLNVCSSNLCENYFDTEHIENGYHRMSGTSMSTPMVTGVAAMIYAKFPNISTSELKSRIMAYCDNVSAFSNKCVSSGRLNAFLACHDHQYTYSIILGSGSHNCVCSICGLSTMEEHDWVTMSVTPPKYRCSICGYIASDISALRIEEIYLDE